MLITRLCRHILTTTKIGNCRWTKKTPENRINLFSVLPHQIGYALMISHSNNSDFIIYELYNDKNLELQTDDILYIQRLYGVPPVIFPPKLLRRQDEAVRP